MKNQFNLIKIVVLLMFLGMISFVSFAQDVDIPLGDIPPGQQITITYDAEINANLPQGLQYIQNQGVVTGSNIDATYSDDPDVFSDGDDETLTPLNFTLPVSQLPITGELPLYRTILMSGLLAMLIAISGVVVYRRYEKGGLG